MSRKTTFEMYARAVSWAQAGRPDDAMLILDSAIGLETDPAQKAAAYRMRTRLNFQRGDHEAAWSDAHLGAQQEAKSRPDALRYWTGEDLSGQSICLHAWEAPSVRMGLGDHIMFARFLPALAGRCARVHFLLDEAPRLMPLLRTASPAVSFEGALPAADFHCHIKSLPHLIGCDKPPNIPYLKHDEERAKIWARVLGADGFKIGVAWNAHHELRVSRSFRLSELEVLGRIPGVRLISLQKHEGVEQLSELKGVEVCDGLDEQGGAFVDTAAVMANLDLIVTCDTSIANLAGALGHPTWVALNHRPDPRWRPETALSLTYPTARLFLQRTPDEWSPVFAEMAQELSRMLESGRSEA